LQPPSQFPWPQPHCWPKDNLLLWILDFLPFPQSMLFDCCILIIDNECVYVVYWCPIKDKSLYILM
jgi:hypothetical protein